MELKPFFFQKTNLQYYLSEKDIGEERAAVSHAKLTELNSNVNVVRIPSSQALAESFIKNYNVVIVIDNDDEEEILRISDICHSNKIYFIKGESKGVFGSVFVDFGEKFVVADVDGEEAESYVISHIANGPKTVFTTSEDAKIDFQTGDTVEIKEVKAEGGSKGFESFNGKVFKAAVNGFYEFEIEEDSSLFGRYITGGVVKKIKQPKEINFKSLRESLIDPGNFDLEDFAKFGSSGQLHFGFRALHHFVKEKGHLPEIGNHDHVNRVVEIAKDLNGKQESGKFKVEEVDEKLIALIAKTSRGNLNPVAAFLSGIIAQEALKTTGKFMPICQWYYFDCREALPQDLDSIDRRPVCFYFLFFV